MLNCKCLCDPTLPLCYASVHAWPEWNTKHITLCLCLFIRVSCCLLKLQNWYQQHRWKYPISSVQIALIYISFQQSILDRFACPELATYMHCDHHKAKPSTVVGIELAELVHIIACIGYYLSLGYTD